MLIFYSKEKNQKTSRKLHDILVKLSKINYKLTKKKAGLIAMEVLKNENETHFWRRIENDFNLKISKTTKFHSCLNVYGK